MSRALLFGFGTSVSMLTMAGVFLQGYATAERRPTPPTDERGSTRPPASSGR